jgi:hypothetical protein
MPSNALYYPYIKVPKSPWFTQVLLYWDRVGAIVPYEYLQDPDRLGKYMVSLVRESLIEQVIPGMHLYRAENFEGAFLRYIDAKYGVNGEQYTSNWAKKSANNGSPIHMEKLEGIGKKLCKRGLAKRQKAKDYMPWYKVEPRIANDFMAYLAGVLGQMSDEIQYSPITDQKSQLNPFIPQSIPEDKKYRVRQLLLENILPAPTKPLEAAQLNDFKQEHKEPLKRFRTKIEDKVSELAAIPDEEFQQMRLQDITASFNETINEITARMQEKPRWPRIGFGTICTIVGSGISAWQAIISQDLKFGLTGAALSLAPAVYEAFRGSRMPFSDQPLAYAAFVKTRLDPNR